MQIKKYKHRTSFMFSGKRYYINADTLEEMYQKKANLLRDLEEGKVLISPHMSVWDWAEKALETYKANIKPDYTQKREISDK